MVAERQYRWVPPGLTEEETEAFLSVNKGIPDSARDALTEWITEGRYGHESYSLSLLVNFQAASGIDLHLTENKSSSVKAARRFFRELNEQTFVYFLDYALSQYPVTGPQNHVPSRLIGLGNILYSAGAGFEIGDRQGRYGLVVRVPAGVAHVVDGVLSQQDKASGMLRRAWEKAYGVAPSPSDAYQDAVKAVEIVANPLISPKDGDATLGKDINVLKGQKDKWHFVMAGSNHTTAVEHVISTMQLLWHSQSDRHGSRDYEDVSAKEAQAAVLLAATLVGWLTQDALQKTP